jgi:hypothetical protein
MRTLATVVDHLLVSDPFKDLAGDLMREWIIYRDVAAAR